MDVYYVICTNCGAEIELDRKPRGESLATVFSATWRQSIRCAGCGFSKKYRYGDVKTRRAQ
jgi:hypothetical protein